MKVMIIAASNLPIPAIKGGATETLVSEMLDIFSIVNDDNLCIDVFSHCTGIDFTNNNVTYHYLDITNIERIYIQIMRVIRLALFKKIYIPDIFPIIMNKVYNVDFSQYDLVLLEGCMQQVITTRKVYKGILALHIHTVMTLTPEINGAKRVCRNCDWLIGNSDFCSSVLNSIEPSNIRKTITIKNCINISQFSENEESFKIRFKKQYSISDDEKCIIFCGRLEKGKGVLELIKAFKEAKVHGRLIIVGSSWFSENKKTKYIAQLEAAAKEIKDRIIFTGYVDHSEIQKYYKCADACVMPSIYQEAAGLVALEAQACGIPVIVSDSGGIHEFVNPETKLIVKTGEGFVEELSQAINLLLTNDDFYNTEKEMAINNISKFNISRYADAFAEFFSKSV